MRIANTIKFNNAYIILKQKIVSIYIQKLDKIQKEDQCVLHVLSEDNKTNRCYLSDKDFLHKIISYDKRRLY